MPLTWGKRRGRTHDPHLDTSPFGPSPNLCSDPDYASEQAGADDGIRTRDPHLGKSGAACWSWSPSKL